MLPRVFLLVFICVSAKPIRQQINKNHSPFPEIKGLEVEFRRALRSRDLVKAFRIESRLEAEVLRAALNAVGNNKNDDGRHEMEQLARIVARDKRMVDALTSMIPPNEEFSANSINEGLRPSDDVDNVGMPPVTNDVLFRKPHNSDSKEELSINVNEINNNTTPKGVTDVGIEPMRIVVEEENVDFDKNVEMNQDEGIDERDKEGLHSTELIKTELVPPVKDSGDFGSQKQVEENPDEGSEPGGIAGILSGFLGSILTPEGGIDINALTGLIGGLSVEKPDGTYDFTGLQDTIGGLFGGGDGGGSDVGLFIGGLTSAFLRGIAGNQGAKGVGKFSGNVVLSVLPGLSAPAQPGENPPPPYGAHPQKAIDPFGFIGGFLKTFLSGSKSISTGQHNYGNAPSKLMQVRHRKPK